MSYTAWMKAVVQRASAPQRLRDPPHAIGAAELMGLREIMLEDIESLAVGAWILGTGRAGSPYLRPPQHAWALPTGIAFR